MPLFLSPVIISVKKRSFKGNGCNNVTWEQQIGHGYTAMDKSRFVSEASKTFLTEANKSGITWALETDSETCSTRVLTAPVQDRKRTTREGARE